MHNAATVTRGSHGCKDAPILNCFGDMRRIWYFGIREIGDRARYLQDAVIGASGPAEPLACFPQQQLARRVGATGFVRLAAAQFAVCFALPTLLPLARGGDAPRYDGAGLACFVGPRGQLRRGQRGQFDLDVDAVEQRS